MVKKALGKGLGALFERAPEEAKTSRSLEIGVKQIIPNKYQPRKAFDDTSLRELTESVRRTGILQPVILRQREDGQYDLIAGERRWRAAQAAGLETIPAVIKEATDNELLFLALIENIQRQDLNPIEAARGYQRLVQEFQMTQEEIALRMGKDRSSVANALRLLSLSVELQEEIRAGRLSTGHAKALLALPRSIDQMRVARQIMKKGLSVRQTERMVKHHQESPLRKKGGEHQPLGFDEVENRLRRHLGTQIRIGPRAKGGTLSIQYYDLTDLDRIVDLILSKSG